MWFLSAYVFIWIKRIETLEQLSNENFRTNRIIEKGLRV